MNIRDLSIRKKLIGGFSLLTIMFVVNAVISLWTLNKSASIIQHNIEVADPSTLALRDLRNVIISSKGYITNWIYQQSNQEDKDALKQLQATAYPKVKESINALKKHWPKAQQGLVDSVLAQYDTVEIKEKQIMTDLADFEDYEKDGGIVKFNATTILETEVLPISQKALEMLNRVIVDKGKEAVLSDEDLLGNFSSVRQVVMISALIVILFAIIATIVLSRDIVLPINYVRGIIQKLSLGELPDKQNRKFNRDEVGEMADAVEKLANGLRETSLFAENIGKGNYKVEHQPLSDKDVLGNSLINMRDNLKRVAEEDKRRNWATEGLAKFGDVLRKNTSDLDELCDQIMSGLVKYTNANQGGLYIINDEIQGVEPYLELKACYAWDKKKYLEQKIYPGEGLAGQVWQEAEYVYMTEVPTNYITITSGLGEANPRSILIVPLKVNDQVYGVLEIASFNDFADFEIEFIEKMAESIASTLSSAKVNIRTQKLLQESTILTEQMRSQEEEMRQNMEELMATQEEMERKQHESAQREEELLAEVQSLKTEMQRR
ncbi:GAF domain-containing protein [Cytophagaceae bacterium DM2B3-1]|uniref:GAF domain-containing protein n=1 Tax=Xanthocytophaga flava TaxID=3048013 RepID=A0ABT7CRP4_9BACT|nr:GAF domain-containing protein [Xanthocytophaga flavus]MDJ1468625.1 GAF domain-containing protein [Xanthocytophaga flavus]MDJ1496405.1 GAF domain-containing protein [Xanthocytophaga flavus]